MPPSVTVDTGIDALTHALEAGGVDLRLALHRRVLRAGGPADLRRPAARRTTNPADLAARTDMANAATLAGLAFSNAFVGTNHALAHAVGARFGIAHGRANGDLPAARAALQRRAAEQVHAGARLLGVRRAGEVRAARPDASSVATTPEESRRRLFQGVEELLDRLDMPRTLREIGVPRRSSSPRCRELAMTAFEDLSNRTNPRMPLVSEITDLLRARLLRRGEPMPTDHARRDDRDRGAVRRGAGDHP